VEKWGGLLTSTDIFLIFVQSRMKVKEEISVKLQAHPTQGLPPERIAGQALGIIQ